MVKVKYGAGKRFSLLLRSKYIVFLSNFIFQGMRYMVLGELLFKLAITVSFCLAFYWFGLNIFWAIFLGHFGNFVINGQFFVLSRYLYSSVLVTPKELTFFLSHIDLCITRFNVKNVFVIGSFCRGSMRTSSDLDLRVYHESGIFGALRAYCFAFYLRFYGFLRGFPMDVYCFSDYDFLSKIREDESPSYFLYSEYHMNRFPDSKSVSHQLETVVSGWVE